MKTCKKGLHEYEGRRCNECKRLYNIDFRENEPYHQIYNKTYYRKNRDAIKAQNKAYAKANPGKVNSFTLKRKADKLHRQPKWLTKEQLNKIEEFYILAKDLQWLSNPCDPLEVDHIIPLRGKTVSGLHVPWNLQILPRSLNAQKGNKLLNCLGAV